MRAGKSASFLLFIMGLPIAVLGSAGAGSPAQSESGLPPAAAGPHSLHLVDLDADGRLDKLCVRTDGSMRVEMNRGRGDFEEIAQQLSPALPGSALATDLDGDGFIDLYLVGPDRCLALVGDGTGRLREASEELGLVNNGLGLGAERIELDGIEPAELVLRTPNGDVVFWSEGGRFRRDEDSAAPVLAAPPQRPQQPGPSVSGGSSGAAPSHGNRPAHSPAAIEEIRPGAESFARGSMTTPTVPLLAAGSSCVPSIVDQAGTGCLQASTVPTLGSLYPLSPSLFVSPSGFVGLGTTSPTTRLDLDGDVTCRGLLNSEAPFPSLRMRGTTGQLPAYEWQAAPDGSCYLYDQKNGGYRIYVSGAGNVGIGTTPPAAKLDVAGNILARGSVLMNASYPAARWQNDAGTGDYRFELTPLGDFYLYDQKHGGHRIFVKGSGNVGIGTESPTAKLDVAGETATNTLRIRGGSDVVEAYHGPDEKLEPGTVVVLDPQHAGEVVASEGTYDRKVVGVVSGAGGVNPGLCLSQEGVLDGEVQVAMVGRVYVKCSAENGAIEPGDLLTSASLPGYAMKATDPTRAFGSVVGKAVTPLPEGNGLVLVIVSLQ